MLKHGFKALLVALLAGAAKPAGGKGEMRRGQPSRQRKSPATPGF
jgi:hypothetical protein